MSATITIGNEIESGRIVHIDEVEKSLRQVYECCGCHQRLSAVKTESRGKDLHFGHLHSADIAACRSTALHDYAVQVLVENRVITVTKNLTIEYSDPLKEKTIFGRRSDVAVSYLNEDVHFEIVVTNDLVPEKTALYKTHRVKCVKIDLSEKHLLTASPDTIKTNVLRAFENKTRIYWSNVSGAVIPVKENTLQWRNIAVMVAVMVLLRWIWKHLWLPRKR